MGSSFEVTGWTNHYTALVVEHHTERLIVCRPQSKSRPIGCIRVRDKDDGILWEIVDKKDVYVGIVPEGCQFEAMFVDVRIITPC